VALLRHDLIRREWDDGRGWGDGGRRRRAIDLVEEHRHDEVGYFRGALAVHGLNAEETHKHERDERGREQKTADHESAQTPATAARLFHRSGGIFHPVPIVAFPYGGWL
jgi:hypothetical protein